YVREIGFNVLDRQRDWIQKRVPNCVVELVLQNFRGALPEDVCGLDNERNYDRLQAAGEARLERVPGQAELVDGVIGLAQSADEILVEGQPQPSCFLLELPEIADHRQHRYRALAEQILQNANLLGVVRKLVDPVSDLAEELIESLQIPLRVAGEHSNRFESICALLAFVSAFGERR